MHTVNSDFMVCIIPQSQAPRCASHHGVKRPKFRKKLGGVQHTTESSSTVCNILRSQTPRCASHRGVKLHGEHQGWELAHRSFPQIAQDKWQLWVNSSCQKINRERIAQVVHNKRATMSDSLRSLIINEQIARFFERIAHLVFCSQKLSDSLKFFYLTH